MQWRDDNTLPSRCLWLRPIGKSHERLAISEDGDAIATASVGSDGAIGTIAGSGFVRAFTRAMVQAPGVASQIAVSPFRRAVRKSEAINDLLTRYHMALMCQVQQTSLCNSVHDATSRERFAQRLSRGSVGGCPQGSGRDGQRGAAGRRQDAK